MDSFRPEDDDRTQLRPSSASAPPATPAEDDRTVIATSTTARDDPPSPAPADDNANNALAVGTMLGEFEIVKVIGEGGFGIVYLAQDTSLKRRVALKEYMPCELASRRNNMQISVTSERHRDTFEMGLRSFVNEAHVLAQFDHPSLVRVFRFWEANGTAYMVMPFVEGMTLKQKLREVGKWNGPRSPGTSPAPRGGTPLSSERPGDSGGPDEAWLMSVLAPLTEALAVIHAEQCYHRDIAPDNIILLAGTGRPLLLDFGAARRVIGDRTQALTAILKHGYAPIEQYAEAPGMKQGPWTDIYALGALLHYAITGHTPPPAVARILDDSYEPLATLAAGRYSDTFLQAIDHALRVRPEQRTQSIQQFREELGLSGTVDHGRTIAMPPAPPPIAVPPPGQDLGRRPTTQPSAATRNRAKLYLLIGGLGAVAIGASVVFLGKRNNPPAAPIAAVEAASAASTAAPSVVAVAPPQPAATPAAPAPVAPFTMAGQFDLIQAAQAPGFTVDAVPAKAALRIGRDKLSFKVSSNRAGYVYVLWNDPDGALYLMFPNKTSSKNAIRPGQTITLPEANWQLDTTKPAGRAHLLVMVSQSPRSFTGLTQGYEYLFQQLPTGDAAAAMARTYTGAGSVLAGRAQCEGAGCDTYGAARFDIDVVE